MQLLCYKKRNHSSDIRAHIFHISNKAIWDFTNQFAEFKTYRHHVLATCQSEIYLPPFIMCTYEKLWSVNYPHEALEIIKGQSSDIDETAILEEHVFRLVDKDDYKKLIKGYTRKQ
jgi:UDP-galactopyranose mutase